MSKKKLSLKLRFNKEDIASHASSYIYGHRDRMKEIGSIALERGYMTYEEFIDMCEWKNVPSKSRVNRNSPELVEEATRICTEGFYVLK